MKVVLAFNKKNWNVSKQIAWIQSFFPVRLDFEIKFLEIDLSDYWASDNKTLKNYKVKPLIDASADVFVLNVSPEDWEASEYLGYAREIEGKNFIAMMSGEGRKRDRGNQGWCDDDEFAGRLRHELIHTFYRMTGQQDRLHEFEYEHGSVESVLNDIKWSKLTHKPPFMKQYINIHHTAILTESDSISQFDSVNRSHKIRFGESVKSSYGYYVGYHYLIERNGVVQQARKDHEVGAHNNVDEMNYKAIGVCFAGNMEEQELTQDQIKAGLELINGLVTKYKIPRENILPHRYFKPTACPGKNTLNFIDMAQNNNEPEWFTKTTRPWAENTLSDVDGFIEDMTPYKVLEVIRKATE